MCPRRDAEFGAFYVNVSASEPQFLTGRRLCFRTQLLLYYRLAVEAPLPFQVTEGDLLHWGLRLPSLS